MKQILKWVYAVACLYWVYLAGKLYVHVLISEKYNAFSPSDIQSIKWTLMYAVLLVFSSLLLLFLENRRH
jgi:site-specific recombinase